MKRFKIIFLLLLSGLFLLNTNRKCYAAETWVTDPNSGSQIAWVSDTETLISASWSGRNVRGKAQGSGVLTLTLRVKDGKERQGRVQAEMVAGKLDGKVIIEWADGLAFEGLYKVGMREGRGISRRANGYVEDGEYKNDKLNGKGMEKWPSGDSYEGTYKDGRFDGAGIRKWARGDSYNGELRAGWASGRGIFKWRNGRVYEGGFIKGEMIKGVLKWPDGRVYNGTFEVPIAGTLTRVDMYRSEVPMWSDSDPKMSGEGILKYPSGATYEGGFANGRPNGAGVLKDPQGAVLFSGEWNAEQNESKQEFSGPAQSSSAQASIGFDAAALGELRERLYELNFDPGPAETPFDLADRQAIREFEAKNNLPATGEVTVALLERLRSVGSQSPWGAIVFAKSSGKWGMAWGHGSRKEAVASALASCGKAEQCSVELSFSGSDCGAFAYSGTTWALAARADAEKAKEAALDDCRKGSRSCRIIASVCASGRGRLESGKPG